MKRCRKLNWLKDKGLEVLYLTDDVDEFVLKTISNYENKSFKNISSDDLNLESEEEKKVKRSANRTK